MSERERVVRAVMAAMMDDGPWWQDEPLELEERAERVLDAVLEIYGLLARTPEDPCKDGPSETT